MSLTYPMKEAVTLGLIEEENMVIDWFQITRERYEVDAETYDEAVEILLNEYENPDIIIDNRFELVDRR